MGRIHRINTKMERRVKKRNKKNQKKKKGRRKGKGEKKERKKERKRKKKKNLHCDGRLREVVVLIRNNIDTKITCSAHSSKEQQYTR